jgi:hypothetical protein
MFERKTGVYPSEHLSGIPLKGRIMILNKNIRLGWK